MITMMMVLVAKVAAMVMAFVDAFGSAHRVEKPKVLFPYQFLWAGLGFPLWLYLMPSVVY